MKNVSALCVLCWMVGWLLDDEETVQLQQTIQFSIVSCFCCTSSLSHSHTSHCMCVLRTRDAGQINIQWSVSAFIFFPLANVKLMKVHFHSHRIDQQLWRSIVRLCVSFEVTISFASPTISSLAGISTAINRVTSCHCTAADHKIDKMHVTRRRNISEPHTDTHTQNVIHENSARLQSSPHATDWLSPVMVCNIRHFLRFFWFILHSLHVGQISHHCPLPFRSNCDEPFGVSEQVVQNYGFACKSQITSFRFCSRLDQDCVKRFNSDFLEENAWPTNDDDDYDEMCRTKTKNVFSKWPEAKRK